MSINILLQTVGAFLIFKIVFGKEHEGYKAVIITALSKYSFGAYLIHMLVFEILREYINPSFVLNNPVITIPILSIIIAGISYCLSALFNKVPCFSKVV